MTNSTQPTGNLFQLTLKNANGKSEEMRIASKALNVKEGKLQFKDDISFEIEKLDKLSPGNERAANSGLHKIRAIAELVFQRYDSLLAERSDIELMNLRELFGTIAEYSEMICREIDIQMDYNDLTDRG